MDKKIELKQLGKIISIKPYAIYLSIYLSISLCISPSFYLSIYLSIPV